MTIGFLGTGHMGASLAKALSKDPTLTLLLCNRTVSKALALRDEIGPSSRVVDLKTLAEQSDYLFIGVKPIDMEEALSSLRPYSPKGVLVSMAAGIELAELTRSFPENPWIRIMPNTPTLIGEGTTFAIYSNVDETIKDFFKAMMSLTGDLIEIKEAKLNLSSVLTGSAPAYLDYFLDALAQGAISLGLTEEQAKSYVLSMAKGTIALIEETKKDPLVLGKEVCSPGGSTIEGVHVMIENGLYEMMGKAVEATYRKNQKMR